MFFLQQTVKQQEVQVGRRKFTSMLLALGLAPTLISCSSSHEQNSENGSKEVILSAQGNNAQQYSMSWLATNSIKHEASHVSTALSGFRGHGVAQHPLYPATAIMVARRPGTSVIEVDLITREITKTFDCANNRHFLGHGCFNKTGSLFFTTEADMKTGKGKIVVRDAVTYQQIAEYESYGIGPHELRLMPDDKTLVIANGGILTHPDTGRKKLNLESMDSSLTYIDINNGQLLDSFKVAETKASIRHLDVSDDGTVAFAMQLQREVAQHDHIIPLGGIHSPEKAIVLLDKPKNLIHQMNDYMGSVAINHKSRIAGFTSPRGNIVAFWDIDHQQLKGYHALKDVCGIAVTDDQQHFVISNSFGQLRQLDAITLKENIEKRISLDHLRWDNHLLLANITA